MSVSSNTNTIYNLFDTMVISQGSAIAISNSSTFTVSVAGIYNVFAEVQFVSNSTGQRAVQIIKNGNSNNGFANTMYQAVSGDDTRISTSTCLSLVVNDYLQIQVWQTSGANLHVGTVDNSGTTLFTLMKVS
jgi:hypothetical protein